MFTHTDNDGDGLGQTSLTPALKLTTELADSLDPHALWAKSSDEVTLLRLKSRVEQHKSVVGSVLLYLT
jgi:hypothetical protein